MAFIAARADSSLSNVTNPNPRLRPVSRSCTTTASEIEPYDSKAARSPFESVSQDKPPTNNFKCILRADGSSPTACL